MLEIFDFIRSPKQPSFINSWDEITMHTYKICRSAHNENIGTVHFFAYNKQSKYINVIDPMHNTKKTIWDDVLSEHMNTFISEVISSIQMNWELKHPKYILSVIGSDNLYGTALTLFQQNIIMAAIKTNAWLFTDGSRFCVSKEIGAAYNNIRSTNRMATGNMSLIGVVDSDVASDWENVNKLNKKLYEEFGFVRTQSTSNSPDYFLPLDHNHPYFLFLGHKDSENHDNHFAFRFKNNTNRLGNHYYIRIKIEEAARNLNPYEKNTLVPIIRIFVGGNSEHLQLIVDLIKLNRPVIVIENTGGISDYVTKYYRALYGENSTETKRLSHYETCISTINSESEENHQVDGNESLQTDSWGSIEEEFKKIIRSKEGYFLLNLLKIPKGIGPFEIDEAILQAQFNAEECFYKFIETELNNLKLSVIWKKYDQAKKYLSAIEHVSLTPTLNDLLNDAVFLNSISLVELFITFGASFDYQYPFIDTNYLFRSLVKHSSTIVIPNIDENGNIKEQLLKYYVKNDDSTNESRSIQTYGESHDVLKSAPYLRNKVVFCLNDIVRHGGYVNELLICLDEHEKSEDSNNFCQKNIYLYAISMKNDKSLFYIIRRYEVSAVHLIRHYNDFYRLILPDSFVYIESDQYLGICLKDFGTPCQLTGHALCYGDWETVDSACRSTYKSVVPIIAEGYRISCQFTIRPTFNLIENQLLWSIFTNHSDLTTCLCSHSKNPIVGSLFVSKIYRLTAEKATNDEKRQEYLTKKQAFDDHAAGIIDHCFNIDKEFALRILEKPSKYYYNYNALELSEENSSRSFLATDCLQMYFDRKWEGYLSDWNYWSSHILMIISVLLAPIWIFPRTPRMLYYHNLIWNFIFLGVFSFVLLVDYFPVNNGHGTRNGYNIRIPITEIFIHICMTCILLDEIIEIVLYWRNRRSWKGHWPLLRFFKDNYWNILDASVLLSYIISCIFRMCENGNETLFVWSKIWICTTFFLWSIRILQFFTASKSLGLKVLMVFHTIKDLKFFGYVIFLFVIGYGISSYSLLTTQYQVIWNATNESNTTEPYTLVQDGKGLWNSTIIRNAINWGMWKVYGQVELLDDEQVDGVKLHVDNDLYGTTVYIYTVIFVCVANVLLLNILIALFNFTLEKIEKDANISLSYQRFLLVNEYSEKFLWIPPQNLLRYLNCLIQWSYGKCKTKLNYHQQFEINNFQDNDDVLREEKIAQIYWRNVISTIIDQELCC